MTNANESVMDGDIAWGGTAQTAHEALAGNGSDAPAQQDAADAVVTCSSSEDLTLEDACIIGGGALAVGGLAYLAYRALFR